MTKHMVFAVLVYMLAYVNSAPVYSVESCRRYPFSCPPPNKPASYIISNANYEQVVDNETAIILSITSNLIMINSMKQQVSGNTPYNRDDAADTSFEIPDVDDSDYGDGDRYEIWETYDVADDKEDDSNDGENFDDGLFFDDRSTY